MNHHAECQCGNLSVDCSAEPEISVACNCVECQRRTGSPFGVGVYFLRTNVTVSGEVKSWTRDTATGRKLSNHFCPNCGTNLYWTLEMRPDYLGVAVGCMTTKVVQPSRAIWTSEKLDWVQFPKEWPTYPKGTPD